jgi:DNA-binding XRE family transcriptional regulator/mannose-6-phosphate isomerase-like protein (cupin superfamily)
MTKERSFDKNTRSQNEADPEKVDPSTGYPGQDKALIGNEVRVWRKDRGLTGAKLAKLADITPGMLTKIELGKVAPSIQTLLSIAHALDVPISIFFRRVEKSRYVSFVPADKRMKVDKLGTRAGHIYHMMGHNSGQAIAIEPYFVRYDEESEPYTTFQEEGFKYIYMMSGHIIYRHGERLFPLYPGDSLIFDAMAPHGPAELIEKPATLISVAVSSRQNS